MHIFHAHRERGRLAGIIAIVGCDGAGKSTLAADLTIRLGAERPTQFLYLGQSSGNIARAIVRVPLIGPGIAKYLKQRSDTTHTRQQSATTPDRLSALIIHLLSRWRFQKFRRMLALQRRGVLVITDRYPQAEVPGFYFDGPGIDAPNATGMVRWLAARERSLYRRMASHVPTLTIRLDVDVETAQARKPDHKLTMLRDKVRVIPTLTFNGAPITALDGRSSYASIVEQALAAAKAALDGPPEAP